MARVVCVVGDPRSSERVTTRCAGWIDDEVVFVNWPAVADLTARSFNGT
jgi:hypothetical protein